MDELGKALFSNAALAGDQDIRIGARDASRKVDQPAHGRTEHAEFRLVIERLRPKRAVEDAASIMVDLHMMAITGGRTRSREQFEALLSQAGFTIAKVTPTRSGLVIIDAVPA